MLSRTITTIILEGSDGVGKDTIAHEMWQNHFAKYRVYVRGELSDYVYAKKYNRPFHSTQRGLPFVYVVLLDSEDSIANKIKNRDGADAEDLKKISDQYLFYDAARHLRSDYHIITYSVYNKTPEECAKEIYEQVDKYANELRNDDSINEYNQMYKKGCDMMGIKLSVKNNQPFFNNTMIMADAQLHNGSYEKVMDKRCPHNLIFSLAYSDKPELSKEKTFDFCYIIGSKINVRGEVRSYLAAFEDNNLTCMTKTDAPDKVFGDEYIKRISKAKATIYTARDLASLEMITVRPYEAALADQILFVDEESDPDNKLLQQIHGHTKYAKLLRVNPDNIADIYKSLSVEDMNVILAHQHSWYDVLRKDCLDNAKQISEYLNRSI